MSDSENAIPIKYVLYTHYWQGEDRDFEAYRSGSAPESLGGISELLGYFRGLKELLSAPGHEGMLVIFYAPGYKRFLAALANGEDVDALLERPDETCDGLCFARDVSAYVRRKLNEYDLGDRVRFLTPLDLRVILGRVNAIFAGKFETFFVGLGDGLRYDAPKVVEAILRLRLLGMGVPVLRVDHDVIFRGDDNRHIGDLGMFKAVACAVRAYRLRVEQTAISTFLFSGSYNARALIQRPDDVDRFEAWSRAFATRIFPALIADPREIRRISSLRDETARTTAWNRYVVDHLDEHLACRFYGLKSAQGRLQADGMNGLIAVGAHPLHGVISGALLCLSDGAILDLPPFSNFANNVMWIDDHLKYSLHRSMNHFRRTGEPLRIDRGLADARLDDVTVTKARPPVKNLPSYVFGVYLPTLLYGTIMDAWITSNPIVKRRRATLTDAERVEWMTARATQDQAPLPAAMLAALRVGAFDDRQAVRLRQTLTRTAVERIEEVRQLWIDLRNRKHKTFASYWAAGTVRRVFGQKCFAEPDGVWEGMTRERPSTRAITSIGHLSTALALKVTKLIDDTLDYVRWTLEWPRFVQIVRSIRQGDFIGDLAWRAPAVPLRRAVSAMPAVTMNDSAPMLVSRANGQRSPERRLSIRKKDVGGRPRRRLRGERQSPRR